jgi:hypothetical protein
VVSVQNRLGFEVKLTDAQTVSPSMRSALESLRLERIDVVHAGDRSFQLAPRIRAVAAGELKRLVAWT